MASESSDSNKDRNSHLGPHIRRVEELAKEFKFKEAIAELDYIIQSGIDLPPVFYSERGYYKLRALDYEGCIADCSDALAINPDLVHALYHRAAANFELVREEASVFDLDRLLEIEPRHALGLYLRAKLYYGDVGQVERSLSAWQAYIEVKPQDWRARLYRGIAFDELGRKQEAIQEYLKGTEINPKMKSFYFRRWKLYRELNELELAQKDYEAGMAILHEPDETPPHDLRDPAMGGTAYVMIIIQDNHNIVVAKPLIDPKCCPQATAFTLDPFHGPQPGHWNWKRNVPQGTPSDFYHQYPYNNY
jgi:tetratricopeptide (TPR) repeat protein